MIRWRILHYMVCNGDVDSDTLATDRALKLILRYHTRIHHQERSIMHDEQRSPGKQLLDSISHCRCCNSACLFSCRIIPQVFKPEEMNDFLPFFLLGLVHRPRAILEMANSEACPALKCHESARFATAALPYI